jgi:methionyl-tRNA synthetase
LGYDVFFNTGTDEHGQKIAQKADDKGGSRQAYVDHYANEFKKLGEVLNLSFDNFIRTTDEAHKRAAQELWKRCEVNGDIYKKKFSGLYCVGCESFKVESDLVDGKCPDHLKAPEFVEEENYFFKLSNYQTYLEEYLSEEGVVEPVWRREEALTFVRGGLQDFSISRERARLDWGVPVPGDDNQVMYVWFDALTNYISTLGWPEDAEGNFKKFWEEGEVIQVAGKDQVRFQSIMWQAMLKSAGVKASDKVVYHGFINSGGQKMSKSLGNVISPYELIARYGTDATRYLLLRHVHPFEDTDITWERLDEWYTANLVNGLGNLVARVMKMAEAYSVPPVDIHAIDYDKAFPVLKDGYLDLQASIEDIWINNLSTEPFTGVNAVDQFIAEKEPFKVYKVNPEEAQKIVAQAIVYLGNIAQRLLPFMPETSQIILDAIKENKKPENLFVRLEK